MLKGFYFPGVLPHLAWREALLPLVERLLVYGVGDNEAVPAAAPVPWEYRVVAPLGGDLPRFQALLREMTGRDAAVIRGQLLAMASRPGRDRDEINGWSLSRALHQMSGKVGEDLARARAERLWQARLFLKLAEAVNVAEDEVSQGLAKLAAKQAEMLRALQGGEEGDDGDEPENTLPVMPWLRPRPDRVFRLRDQLAAWAVFYLQDPAPEPLLLTDDPEAAALLADEVEKLAPGQVVTLPELDLGLTGGEVATLVKALQMMLTGEVEAGRAALEELAGSRCISRQAGAAGSMILRVCLLPAAEFRRVMVEVSGWPGEEGVTASTSPYVLVGVATPGEATCKD